MKFLKLILVIVLFLLEGCGNRREDFRTLKLAIDENPTTLDPALIVDVSGGSISAKIFNGLVRVDKNLKITGDLAESWNVSGDGKEYTFNIREGVKFHNGRELGTDDFKRSFERVLNPATGSSRGWIFEKIKGAEDYVSGKNAGVSGINVIDKKTIKIILDKPFAPFLWVLTMPNAYVVPVEEVEKWGKDFSSHVVGTGPFRLKEWIHDYKIVLESNKDYFGNPPKVGLIEYRVIPDQFSAMAEFENGNIDIVSIPKSEYKNLISDSKKAPYIHSRTGLNVYYLGFNCKKPPFDNPLVRKAFNYSIDRDIIVKNLMEDRVVSAKSVLPPGLSGSDKPESGYPYSPETAVKLLKQAGIRGGLEINIYQNRTSEASNILETVQDYLGKAGIKAHIVQREWSSFKEAVIKGEADMFLLSWWADYPDPENFFFPNFHSSNFGAGGNKACFKDPEIDRMIEESLIIKDETARNKLYEEINRAIFEASPWVFLWHKKEFVITQPWIKGYYLYPIYNSDKGTDISIDESNINALGY